MTEDRDFHSAETIREAVRQGYGQIAEKKTSSCCAGPSCCGGGDNEDLAKTIGYSEAELADLPEGANMGLSCGNPTALASLQPGETVLDLGSGGGFDVFIAARKVGPTGRAIGVDMTPEMLAKARRNVPVYESRSGLRNVEFRLGEIEHLPVADGTVDVIISNCVINLSPNKPQVWREIARVLKPGGRVAVSDIALLKPLPESARECIKTLVGCVAGAALVEETKEMIRAAGLDHAEFELKSAYIDSMAEWSDPVFRKLADKFPTGTRASDYVTSMNVTARKQIQIML